MKMPEAIKPYIDWKINVTTIGTILLCLLSVGMYIQQQDARIVAVEKATSKYDTQSDLNRIEMQRLSVAVEGMRVSILSLERALEKQERDRVYRDAR